MKRARIGTASRVITPAPGCEMAGFDARKGVAQGVRDDLHARALVLDDGRTKAAIVSVEVIGISRGFADEARRAVEVATGIPAAHVVIAATHTHCGPVTLKHFFNQGQELDASYLRKLRDGIVEAALEAHESRRPRRLRVGMARVEGVAVNRRTADGQPVDPIAGVLLVEESDQTPVALFVTFACHTTVLGPNTLDITADFPHYTIQRLRERLGAQVTAIYCNGAEGDLSIGHKSDLSAVGVIAPYRTFEKAEELGNRLADAILAGLPSLVEEIPEIRVRQTCAPLPLKGYAAPPRMAGIRREAKAAIERAEGESHTEPAALLTLRQKYLFSRIEEYYSHLYATADSAEPKILPAEVTAIAIGNTALVSLPGEVFVGIALKIRERSPFVRTMFLGLANDYIGYVPTPEASATAGYEVVASRVLPEAADVLENEAVALLHSFAMSCAGVS